MKALRLTIVPAVLLAAFATPVARAGSPLMVLEYTENDKIVQIEVQPKTGVFLAPQPPKAAPRWRIAPGSDQYGTRAPPERSVELLRKSGDTVEPLCIVYVRYYRHEETWRPAYRLDETPLFVRDASGQWRPITVPGGGNPALLQRLGSALPNADGYFPEIEFSLSTGPVAIDSWVVR